MSSDSPSTLASPTAAASLADLASKAGVDPGVLTLLDSVGIETCADLAALDHDAVAVRCGVEGVRLWRFARGLIPPHPTPPSPPEPPSAEVAWTDYELRDVEHLLFAIHGLVGTVCDTLQRRGQGTRTLTLHFSLASQQTLDHTVGAARASASRTGWMRRIRTAIERLRLPDAVTGLSIRADAAELIPSRQGDVFDRGFATAAVTEQAMTQLLDAGIGSLVIPSPSSSSNTHPLPERRLTWSSRTTVDLSGGAKKRSHPTEPPAPSLTLQLLPIPQPITVQTAQRRGHSYPMRYTEAARSGGKRNSRRTTDLLLALGPDHIAGGQWEEMPFARAYFHCVTSDGRLVLLCWDGVAWSLQGWWD